MISIQIEIDIDVESETINDVAMEKIRLAIRNKRAPLILETVDEVAERNDYRFSRRDVVVDGFITLVDK